MVSGKFIEIANAIENATPDRADTKGHTELQESIPMLSHFTTSVLGLARRCP
jgi:hypothetical protein